MFYLQRVFVREQLRGGLSGVGGAGVCVQSVGMQRPRVRTCPDYPYLLKGLRGLEGGAGGGAIGRGGPGVGVALCQLLVLQLIFPVDVVKCGYTDNSQVYVEAVEVSQEPDGYEAEDTFHCHQHWEHRIWNWNLEQAYAYRCVGLVATGERTVPPTETVSGREEENKQTHTPQQVKNDAHETGTNTHKESPIVPVPHTVVEPLAMVVELRDAFVTSLAVFRFVTNF